LASPYLTFGTPWRFLWKMLYSESTKMAELLRLLISESEPFGLEFDQYLFVDFSRIFFLVCDTNLDSEPRTRHPILT